jgi:hypothetical protein
VRVHRTLWAAYAEINIAVGTYIKILTVPSGLVLARICVTGSQESASKGEKLVAVLATIQAISAHTRSPWPKKLDLNGQKMSSKILVNRTIDITCKRHW